MQRGNPGVLGDDGRGMIWPTSWGKSLQATPPSVSEQRGLREEHLVEARVENALAAEEEEEEVVVVVVVVVVERE